MLNTIRHILQVKGWDTWFVRPDSSVFEALKQMADREIGALLVMEGDHLVGIFSERDYARKVILKGKASKDTPVAEIMTSTVFTIHPDQTVQEAMELMTEKHVRHLPVVEGDKVIGMVSIGDVVRSIIYQQKKIISEMENKIISG
ncbi:histidine kinase [Ornatilinea apprima]|uniref:Histidine kinase n=1 Tax=Ornatilinea apprima TaxID=1134406 RepID=A0A0P6XB48_9CHLR|nr:CBS domain-containing protein [Ornatilinea apprima]KPL76963.1 histidine kinase [Ornatilinea apprima]